MRRRNPEEDRGAWRSRPAGNGAEFPPSRDPPIARPPFHRPADEVVHEIPSDKPGAARRRQGRVQHRDRLRSSTTRARRCRSLRHAGAAGLTPLVAVWESEIVPLPSVPMTLRHRPIGSLPLPTSQHTMVVPVLSDDKALAAAGGAIEEGYRPPMVATPAAASPELLVRPLRRTFTARDKSRILAEVDTARVTPGGIGAVLRREGPYSSALSDCHRQRGAGAFAALHPVARGPKTTPLNSLAAEHARLLRDNKRLTQRLERPEAIIDLQKNSGLAGLADRQRRGIRMEALAALAPGSGMIAASCAALGVSRASLHRRK